MSTQQSFQVTEVTKLAVDTDERRNLPSASGTRGFELCSGRFQLEQEARAIGQEAHVTSDDAQSGTAIHAKREGLKVELTEKESETYQLLDERSREQVERIFQPGVTYDTLREKRLWLEIEGKPVLSGQFDACYYNAELALLQDWKTSWREPDPAEDNAQMRTLAVLVALALPSVQTVVVQIISGPYGVTEATYDLRRLAESYNWLVALLRTINQPDAPLNPSPEACRYCRAILICQAVKDQVVTPLVKLQMSALPADGPAAAKILDQVEIFSNLAKEIKKFYQGKFEDPTYRIPGYEIVPGNIIREVTDWDTAQKRLSEFLPEKALKGAADYRLGDLERELGKALGIKGKALRERMNAILSGLYVERQNAGSLKRIK